MKIKNKDWDCFLKTMKAMNYDVKNNPSLSAKDFYQFQKIEELFLKKKFNEKHVRKHFVKLIKEYGSVKNIPQYFLCSFAVQKECPLGILDSIINNGLNEPYLLKYILYSQNGYGISTAMKKIGTNLSTYSSFYHSHKRTINDAVFGEMVYDVLTVFLIEQIQSGLSIAYEDFFYIFQYTHNDSIGQIINLREWGKDVYYAIAENQHLSDEVRLQVTLYLDDYLLLSCMPKPLMEELGQSAIDGFIFDGKEFTPAWRYLNKIIDNPNVFMSENQQLDFIEKINNCGINFQLKDWLYKLAINTHNKAVLGKLIWHRNPDIAKVALMNRCSPPEDVSNAINALVYMRTSDKDDIPVAYNPPAILFNKSVFLSAFKTENVLSSIDINNIIYITKQFDKLEERTFLTIPNIPFDVLEYMKKHLVSQRKFMANFNYMVSNINDFSFEEKTKILKLFDTIIFYENYMLYFDKNKKGEYKYNNPFIKNEIIKKNPLAFIKLIRCVKNFVEQDIGKNIYKEKIKNDVMGCLNVLEKYAISIKKGATISDCMHLLSYQCLSNYCGDIWHNVKKLDTTYDIYSFASREGIGFAKIRYELIYKKEPGSSFKK